MNGRFTPKGTVLQVQLYNKNVNGRYAVGSGLAYITEGGSIWLDGHIYPVGDSAYLHNETYYPEPPEGLKELIERSIAAHVGMLIEESAKMDRDAIAPEKVEDFLGIPVKYKDTSTRYRNLSGQDHNQREIGGKIDAITKKHDPQAIHDAIFTGELDRYRFEIGGILHISNTEYVLSPVQKQAILHYQEQGGRLGRTAYEALGTEFII